MNWKQLLSKKRIGENKKSDFQSDRTAFQRDYDRIIFSTAFRRLQDKTQVFPLSKSDYVRTRLTHSLEVSCIARNLGMKLGIEICNRHNIPDIQPGDISTILATAALAHDIGNPPFGHSGENAIRHWFTESPLVKKLKFSKKERLDIENYEGNAQGFRLLTVLQMPENSGGMQLTSAAIASFVKYPVEACLIKSSTNVSRKKFNFFQTEKEMFKANAEEVGLIREEKSSYGWSRHPLSFLVEACDDICYRLIDFEDGFKLGLVSFKEIEELFYSIIEDETVFNKSKKLNDEQSVVEYLRAKSIQKMVEEISELFLDSESSILNGKMTKTLISSIPSAKALKALKNRAIESVYCDRRVLEIEAAGFEVANGILELFYGSAIDSMNNKLKATAHSKKIMQLLPKQFHPAIGDSNYLSLLKVLDFFSGMTDSYAVALYKKIKGISISGE